MAKRIQIRRDTAANWTSSNPILAQGEFGYETNTKKFKIGDGITAWSSLSYFTSGGSAPTYQTITIAVADWSGGTTCSKTVSGVTASSYQTYYFASDASWLEAGAAKVRPTGQGVNSITFTAATTPTADISFNIEIKEV